MSQRGRPRKKEAPLSLSISLLHVEPNLIVNIDKIAQRENTSRSAIVLEAMKDYVKIHAHGNPQTMLNSYARGSKVDVGAVEGRIRQHFLERHQKSLDVKRKDILNRFREEFEDVSQAVKSTERVVAWLWGQGIRIWR